MKWKDVGLAAVLTLICFCTVILPACQHTPVRDFLRDQWETSIPTCKGDAVSEAAMLRTEITNTENWLATGVDVKHRLKLDDEWYALLKERTETALASMKRRLANLDAVIPTLKECPTPAAEAPPAG